MLRHIAIAGLLALSFLAIVPSSLAKPDLPVGVCVDGKGTGGCGGALACVGISQEVPVCVPRDPCDGTYFSCACDPSYCTVQSSPHAPPVPTVSGVQCMERYQRVDVGPATIISRSSCEYEVYLFGEPLLS